MILGAALLWSATHSDLEAHTWAQAWNVEEIRLPLGSGEKANYSFAR